MAMAPIEIELPAICQAAVKTIESFLISDKVKASSLKIEMESTSVDLEDIDDYINILLKRFADSSESVKGKIESLRFKKSESMGFCFENKSKSGKYNMTLIASSKDKANNEYKIFMFYYDKSCEYTNLSSWWRSIFGCETNLNSIFTEQNLQSFLVYKLVNYARDFNKNVVIKYKDSNNNPISN